jgi:EAL domain-containing protein (putative c-di-GMP-specific phosphodiesterase class I)
VRDEFEVYFQPLVDLDSGALRGWSLAALAPPGARPDRPAQFIPLAEESGLIVGLGHWVMRQAAPRWRS